LPPCCALAADDGVGAAPTNLNRHPLKRDRSGAPRASSSQYPRSRTSPIRCSTTSSGQRGTPAPQKQTLWIARSSRDCGVLRSTWHPRGRNDRQRGSESHPHRGPGQNRKAPRAHRKPNYPKPFYKRPRYTEKTLTMRLPRRYVVAILNREKDPTRIGVFRNPDGDPRLLFKVVRNDDSLVFEHELQRLNLADQLPDGDYSFDSRSALTLLGLAGMDTTPGARRPARGGRDEPLGSPSDEPSAPFASARGAGASHPALTSPNDQSRCVTVPPRATGQSRIACRRYRCAKIPCVLRVHAGCQMLPIHTHSKGRRETQFHLSRRFADLRSYGALVSVRGSL
jgi:hypothetical protein